MCFEEERIPRCVLNRPFAYHCNNLTIENRVVSCGCKVETDRAKGVYQEDFVPYVVQGLKEVY